MTKQIMSTAGSRPSNGVLLNYTALKQRNRFDPLTHTLKTQEI